MGGRDVASDIQAILERLMSPISESEKPGLRAEIEALTVPKDISEGDMYTYFFNIYTYFHTQGISETHTQKRARQLNTREFYRLLGVKLLRGKPQSYAEIPKQIYALKLQEQETKEINASMAEFFNRNAKESAKEFTNAVLKGGRKKRNRTRKPSKKIRGST